LKALTKAIKYINQHPPEWKDPGVLTENNFSRKTLNTFAKAIQYIHKHPLEWTSPNALCSYIDINQATLQAVFLHKTGRTISEYYETIRITISCMLLVDETLSTKEIAALCGYSSQSSFNKAFKRVRDVSPGKWMINNENHSLEKIKPNLLDNKNDLLDKKADQIDKQ
jgi:transcriptional regulator GlxA family with amidase domain